MQGSGFLKQGQGRWEDTWQHAWTAMNHRWNNRNMVGKIVKDNPLLLLPMLISNQL